MFHAKLSLAALSAAVRRDLPVPAKTTSLVDSVNNPVVGVFKHKPPPSHRLCHATTTWRIRCAHTPCDGRSPSRPSHVLHVRPSFPADRIIRWLLVATRLNTMLRHPTPVLCLSYRSLAVVRLSPPKVLACLSLVDPRLGRQSGHKIP